MIPIDWATLGKASLIGAIALAAMITRPAYESVIESALERKRDDK